MAKTPLTVRALREKAKLSPADIERATGGIVKRPALGQIERGKVPNPTLKIALALMATLGVDAHTFQSAVEASLAEARKGRTRRHPTTASEPAVLTPRPARPSLDEAIVAARQLTAILEAWKAS